MSTGMPGTRLVSSARAAARGHRGHPGSVLAAVSAAAFMAMLDNLAVTNALPAMGEDLGLGTNGLQWAVASYPWSSPRPCCQGAAGDRLGQRRAFLTGLLGFMAGSAVSSLATTLASAGPRPRFAGRDRWARGGAGPGVRRPADPGPGLAQRDVDQLAHRCGGAGRRLAVAALPARRTRTVGSRRADIGRHRTRQERGCCSYQPPSRWSAGPRLPGGHGRSGHRHPARGRRGRRRGRARRRAGRAYGQWAPRPGRTSRPRA